MIGTLRVFTGRSNPKLGKDITDILKLKTGEVNISNFSDGELRVGYNESIRGTDLFIIQSTNPPGDNLLELLFMIDAAKRASAGRITAVIPYFGYARQDRKDQPRVPISSRVCMDAIASAGTDRIVVMDIHSSQIQGFVKIPFDHLYAKPLFISILKEKIKGHQGDFGVVATDVGGIKFARSYATKLGLSLTIIDKRRPRPNVAEVVNVIGDINFKHAIIIDDMIDTGGSVLQAAKVLKNSGCETVSIVATHGVFSGPCFDRLADDSIDEVIVTDSIQLIKENHFDKLKIVTAAPLFADAIKRIHDEETISLLFEI